MGFDLVVRNGVILDGSGNPWYWGDVGVASGVIAAIGVLRKADRVIDARGMVVAPGFIDIHSHSDYNILREPRAESKVRQGVTTRSSGTAATARPP